MTQPLATLTKGLISCEGGYAETVKEQSKLVPKEDRRCFESFASSQMFFERLLFNRNTLQTVTPTDVFSAAVRAVPSHEMNFRCALSELGGERFSESEAFPYFEDEGEKTAAYSRYKNIPLRLGEKNAEKVVEAFEMAWPPMQYDGDTLARIESLREEYPEAFDEPALDAFVAQARDQVASFGRLSTGKEAFRALLLRKRFRESLLMTLPVWDVFDKKAPYLELVDRLAEDFSTLGYERRLVGGFSRLARLSFTNYFGDIRLLDDADFAFTANDCLERYGRLVQEHLVPEAYSFFRECVDGREDEADSEFLIDEFWLTINKAAMVYNLVVSAVYGPAQARENCYALGSRRTSETRGCSRWDYAPEDLLPHTGQALLRRIDRSSARHLFSVDLDSPPKFNESKVICVFGSNFEKSRNPMPETKNKACSFFATLEKDDYAAAFCQIGSPDEGVSGWHAGIAWIDGKVTLVDLSSRNGTFVDSAQGVSFVAPSGSDEARYSGRAVRRVPSVILRRGDIIVLSDVAIEVL